jgi:hypothetical protein
MHEIRLLLNAGEKWGRRQGRRREREAVHSIERIASAVCARSNNGPSFVGY